MKSKTTSEEIQDESWASENWPTRDKFTLWFLETDRGLELNMVVPLDSSRPDEAKARELYTSDEDTFPVHCIIDPGFNLDAERETFTQRLRELYESDIGKILRRTELSKISDSELRQVLQPLVSQGQNVFRRLFVSEKIKYDYSDEEVPIVKAAVLSAFSRRLCLCINSNCPLFPWAFLYYDAGFDSSNYSTIKPERFWGFKHEIQEEFSTTAKGLHVNPCPVVVTAVDPLIDNGGWHDDDDHPFAKVPGVVDASNIGDLKKNLANFEGHCLYFYGHADHAEHPTQATSWLELQQLKLYVSDLEPLRAPQFKNNPVVAFLNGCNTSPLTRWDSNTVVGYLCNEGKQHLCCVASVGQLPAPFAAAFAREFWQRFLIDRLPIGTALRLARNYMLHEWNNPLGLLYSLFGKVDTFILPDSAAQGTNPNMSVSEPKVKST